MNTYINKKFCSFKFTGRHRSILYKKLKWFSGEQYVGYILPTEILYLMSIGCKQKEFYGTMQIEGAHNSITNGQMYSRWFYFIPTPELVEKIGREPWKA